MDRNTSIGQLVKERRKSLNLTQAEVARQVGCAAITIRKIEANALRPSTQMAELIAQVLHIPEVEQTAFIRLARVEPQPDVSPTPTSSLREIGLTDLSGRIIKGFHLEEQIGNGGFGVVYRAVQPSVERDVAIKIILPHYANQPNFIRRFEAEAQIIARLEHPHIVPLYDYWRESNAAYLIMRLLRGGSLENQLKQGAMAPELVLQYIQQIGNALDMAHRHGIIHRDIKSANILIDEESNAYLADFGIAKDLESINSGVITEGGGLIGSLAYVSPEQILSEPVKPQSDIYGLGILLYEMLTGHKPFIAPTPLAYIQYHLYESLPSLHQHKPELPLALDDVIRQATARHVGDRFADVPALLEALQRALRTDRDAIGEETPIIQLNSQELSVLENPYRGLRAFGESDASNFHGRTTLTQELLARLDEDSDLMRFLAVVGPSGSGKSSVVKAGLLPILRRGGLPGSENWFFLDITPGPHPWEELETAFLRVAVNPPETLLGQLQDGERGLIRAVQRILPDDDRIELVLMIDQFEELFTLVTDEVVREQFLDGLVTAVIDPRSRLRVMITLRADFYDRPLQYVDFGDLLRQRTVMVLPMSPDELEEAITQPAAQVGVQLETGLVAAIVREVDQQPGSLPLLQYALTELFETREHNLMTRVAYEVAGEVAGALARRADEIFENLSASERIVARQLFLRLITLGEGVEDTRRRALQVELATLTIPGVYDAAPLLEKVIERYGRYRLLTFDHDPTTRTPTVEVAHEALLREWDRLRSWLADSRTDVRLQRLLAIATQEWLAGAKEDGFLLRGARLDQFEGWFEETSIALTQDEQAFLTASRVARQQRRTEEKARQQRELETAQQLVETERQRVKVEQQRVQEQVLAAQILRRRAIYLGVALVVALVLAITAVAFSNQSTQNANLAVTKEAIAQDNFQQAEQQRLAAQALSNDDSELSALLALRSLQLGYSEEADLALLSALDQGFNTHTYQDHFGQLSDLAISPNGRFLASAGGNDFLLVVRDMDSNEIVQQFNLRFTTRDVTFTPDSRSVVMSDGNGQIYITDLEQGKLIRLVESSFSSIHSAPLDIASQNNQMLVGARGYAYLLDLSSGEPMQYFRGHQTGVSSVVLAPDGQMAFTGSLNGEVFVWDVATGEKIIELTGPEAFVTSMDISPDGKNLISSSSDGHIFLWEIDSGEIVMHFVVEPITRLEGQYESRASELEVNFSPDGRLIAISTPDRQLQLYDRQTGQLRRVWSNVGGGPMTWMPDGSQIATSSVVAEVNLWQIPNQQHPLRLSQHSDAINSLVFSSQGDMLLSSSNGEIRRWDTESGTLLQHITSFGTGDRFVSAVFDEQAEQILAIDGRGLMHQWDMTTRRDDLGLSCLNTCSGLNYTNRGFSANGRYALVRNSALNLGEVLDTATGSLKAFGTPRPNPDLIQAGEGVVAYLNIFGARVSSNGRWVTYIDTQDVSSVQLWDADNAEMIHTLTGHTSRITAVDFSADNQSALTASADGTTRIWDISTGQEIQQFVIPNTHVEASTFSPDGRFILTGDSDGMARLSDVATGEQIRVFGGQHEGGVTAVAFSPDGQRIATGDGAGDIRIWDVNLDNTIQLACAQLPRDFTDVERELYNIPHNSITCSP